MKDFTQKVLTFITPMIAKRDTIHDIAINCVKSDIAKELHREGMYSEKEVLNLIEDYLEYYCSTPYPTDTVSMWLDKNKKV